MSASLVGFGPVELLILLGFGGGFGLPVGIPPMPPDPIVMRAAPEECLYSVSWSGMATPDPESANHTERLLAEEEVQRFMARVEGEIVAAVRRGAGSEPTARALAGSVPGLVKTLLTRPAAVYLSHVELGERSPTVRGGLVVNTGDDKEQVRAAIMQLEVLLLRQAPPGTQIEESEVGGITLRHIPTPSKAPPVFWGFRGEYLVLAVGDGAAEELMPRLNEDTPLAPWMIELTERLPVDRPAVVSYLNVAGGLKAAEPLISSPQIRGVLDALGIGGIESVGSVVGLDQQGTVSRMWVKTRGEPTGLLAVLSDRPLKAADLAPIPVDANFAAAARVDLADVYRRALDGVGQVDPDARANAERAIGQFEDALGIRLGDDLLKPLGDVWCLFDSPSEGGSLLTGLAITVDVRDRLRLEQTHSRLVRMARDALDRPGEVSLRQFNFHGQTVYYLLFGGGEMFMPLAPSWCLTDKHLVVTLYPQMMKAYLSRGPQSKSLADAPQVAARLAAETAPSTISYQDTRAFVRLVYSYVQMFAPMMSAQLAKQGVRLELSDLPSLSAIDPHLFPTTSAARRLPDGLLFETHQSFPGGGADLSAVGPIGIGVALLLPAVQAAREAARRTTAANTLKQIGLAMHNYYNTHRSLPAAAIYDKQGQPLLSWRVHVLPFVEEQALYQQFHLDEPWDSPHNRTLIERMPAVYGSPNYPELNQAGKTTFQVPTGEGLIFDGKQGVSFAAVLDGLSNTIMAVETTADAAVPWTKPDELEFDKSKPFTGLRGARPNGFQVLFGDGSVQFVSDHVDADLLRALFTRAGGESINSRELSPE